VERPTVLELAPGRRALAADVERTEDVPAALEALGLRRRPVLVVVGGASGLADDAADALAASAEGLVRSAAATGAAIVDGGTDAGEMRLLGTALGDHDVPLVGVVPRALAALPGETAAPESAALEPHHTHFVLVPGTSWGDESRWLACVATALAGPRPSVTVLLNGGDIAWIDVAESLDEERPVLAVAGSGRTADVLAAALFGSRDDARADALAATGLVEAVPLREDAGPSLERKVKEMLAHG
jgi:hypothetical protein